MATGDSSSASKSGGAQAENSNEGGTYSALFDPDNWDSWQSEEREEDEVLADFQIQQTELAYLKTTRQKPDELANRWAEVAWISN